MTTSLIIGAIIVIAAILWIIRSGKKESRHLDDLHITGTQDNKE